MESAHVCRKDWISGGDADIFIQETKMQAGQLDLIFRDIISTGTKVRKG